MPANRRVRTMAAEVAGKSPESVQADRLAARLARAMTGDVLFDAFNRGRYATDASFYQIVPAGVGAAFAGATATYCSGLALNLS